MRIDLESLTWKDILVLSNKKINEIILKIWKEEAEEASTSRERLVSSLGNISGGIFTSMNSGNSDAIGWWEDRGDRTFIRILVAPEYRNNGVGTSILDKLVEQIKKRYSDNREIRVMLWDTTDDTMDFFRNRGYNHMYTEIELQKELLHSTDVDTNLSIQSFTERLLPLFYSTYKKSFSSRTFDLQPVEKWRSFWCPVDDPEFTPGLSLLLYEGDEPAAYCVTYCEKESSLVIGQLGVAADYQRKGYGKKILDEISTRAYRDGYTTLSLRVDENNTKAIKLYEIKGFNPVSTLTMFKKVV